MEADESITCQLIQLKRALTQVKNNTDKYVEQSQKCPKLLADLTKSLNQLKALNPHSKV